MPASSSSAPAADSNSKLSPTPTPPGRSAASILPAKCSPSPAAPSARFIDNAPTGPFDAASCLLTFHFLSEPDRRRTLAEVHRRLKPGAPFVVAHFSFPQTDAEKTTWLSRYAAFATASGVPAENLKNATAAIREQLSILSPTGDETLLREAGFTDISLFYTAFTFRGWVCYKT
jgi:tRNA (cmo5U34)-methyltransferase